MIMKNLLNLKEPYGSSAIQPIKKYIARDIKWAEGASDNPFKNLELGI